MRVKTLLTLGTSTSHIIMEYIYVYKQNIFIAISLTFLAQLITMKILCIHNIQAVKDAAQNGGVSRTLIVLSLSICFYRL